MFRVPLADILAAAALAVLLSILIPWVRPSLTDDEFSLAIGNPSETLQSSLPRPTFSASVTDYQRTRRNQHQITISSPSEGLFTVTGAAFDADVPVPDLRIWLNDDPVSFSALRGESSLSSEPIRFRAIKHNVRLRTGENRMDFRSQGTESSLVFRFQRQEPASSITRGAIGASSFAVLLILSVVLGRLARGDYARLIAINLTAIGFVVATLAWIHFERGAELDRLGNFSSRLTLRLKELRDATERLASEREKSKTRVATFGDSTHQSRLLDFKDGLAGALEREHPGQFEVYGLSHGGMTGRDYYLLLSSIIASKPDVLVLPINVVTFEDRWYNNRMWHFSELDRFLRFDEFPRVIEQKVGVRHFRWDHILLRKADWAWFDGAISRFTAGMRLYVTYEAERLTLILNGRLKGIPANRVIRWQFQSVEREVVIDPDSEMIAMFRRINDFAQKNGVRVVYYTTPLNDEAQSKQGIHFLPQLNFETIEAALSGPAHVKFLRQDRSFPVELFRDDLVHLRPQGIQYLADQVALEVEAIAREGNPGP